MKIREFFNVEGFDPKKCRAGLFFSSLTGAPYCPIGHAAALRGFFFDKKGPSWDISQVIADTYGLNKNDILLFAKEYDARFNWLGTEEQKATVFEKVLNWLDPLEAK